MILTQERLRQVFSYNRDRGHLINNITRCGRAVKGQQAGTWSAKGKGGHVYRQVCVDGATILEHRVIWIMMHGDINDGMQVDHINGDTKNNKLENLRLVTPQKNQRNARLSKRNKSTFPGVKVSKTKGKWEAQIGVNRKCIYLGTFTTREDAIEARQKANIKYGFHENHGRCG